MGLAVSIKGIASGNVLKALNELKTKKANEVARRSLEAGARITGKALRQEVPVEFGVLKKAIGVKSGTSRSKKNHSYAMAGARRRMGQVVEISLERRGRRRGAVRAQARKTRSNFRNPTRYFHLVDLGHRTRNGGFVAGRHALSKAVNRTASQVKAKIQAEYIRRLKLT